jgi:hypothetical protein
MKSGFAVGTIAGLIAGIWGGLVQDLLFINLGLYYLPITDIYIYFLNAIPSLGINAIFGAFFGLLGAIIFDSISGNRILKGLAIGLIYCLFTALYPVHAFWAFDNPVWAYVFLISSPIDKFIYGIVFAFLYKK